MAAPDAWCRMANSTARHRSQVPPSSARKITPRCAGPVSNTVPPPKVPAAVKSTLLQPQRASTAAAYAFVVPARPTSEARPRAVPQPSSIYATTASAAPVSRSRAAAWAPSRAMATAVARPNLESAPVTIATDPANLMSVRFLSIYDRYILTSGIEFCSGVVADATSGKAPGWTALHDPLGRSSSPPSLLRIHMMRTYARRSRSSRRPRARRARATLVARRPSMHECNPPPITRLNLLISASTMARQL